MRYYFKNRKSGCIMLFFLSFFFSNSTCRKTMNTSSHQPMGKLHLKVPSHHINPLLSCIRWICFIFTRNIHFNSTTMARSVGLFSSRYKATSSFVFLLLMMALKSYSAAEVNTIHHIEGIINQCLKMLNNLFKCIHFQI